MQNYKLYKGAWVFAGDPSKSEKLTHYQCVELLNRGGVRETFDFDCKEKTSFWFVIKDSFGGMDELSAKMRNQVRKCFKTMRVERISAAYLSDNGYEVYVAACDNYHVKAEPPTREQFEARIRNAVENEYWGAIDITTGNLVAFCMNAVTDECCEYRTMKAIPKYQKLYAYYGLIYEMNRYYLEERKLGYVSDGARSITNHSNIQPFLIEKFKFRKAYCRLRITYKWWLGMAVCMLYPFRKTIRARRVRAMLDMGAMARGEM